MTSGERILDYLRSYGTEDPGVEAKRAAKDLPKSVVETLSAFANTPGGGILLLGVDEASGFAVTGVENSSKIAQDLAGAARDQLTPPLVPDIHVWDMDGLPIVVAEVPELPRSQKPCYITSKGMSRGSYIRVADGDRQLTDQEVQQLLADRGQPLFDHEVVAEASIDDLDSEGVQALLGRVRQSNPRIFVDASDESILCMLNVLRRQTDGSLRPTIAGLISLGRYPQQFFPQLCLTFVHYPTNSGESSGEIRFLDNVRFDGSIPEISRAALSVVQRNMTRRALVSGHGRTDVWEYPLEALREAIVNALVHRDLSPGTRGTQVQVEMYPDRLRIMNPGGLYGAVDITRLGEEGVSSSRNALLLKILEDVPVPGETRTVCENRGSGIRTMRTVLSRAGMSPPEFRDKVTSFEVVMPNHTLFDEDTVRWLGTLGRDGLKDTQRAGLALMLKGYILDNARYRAATGISDSRIATAELQDLVARELIEQTGTRGGARYKLSDYARSLAAEEGPRVRPNRQRQILELLALNGELSKAEISTLLNISPKTAEYWISRLKRATLIEPTEPGKGKPNTKYRLTRRTDEFPGQESLFKSARKEGQRGSDNDLDER